MANFLKPEKVLAIIACLIEGNSVRATERLTGTHRDTVLRTLVRFGELCQEILDTHIHDVDCYSIQVDEIWAYVFKKQGRLTDEDRYQHPERGDTYTFVGLDADSKLVISHVVGKRNAETTVQFIQDLASRLNGNRPQIVSDGFDA